MDYQTLQILLKTGYENILANAPQLFIPAVIYAVVATAGALLLGWGRIFYEIVGNIRVLKLPGGGLLASLPIPEMLLSGWVMSQNPVISAGTPTWGLLQFLTFFGVLRLTLAVITHALGFLGSVRSYADGHGFAIECMDGRCDHGSRSGNFLHYFACGGATLLTAVTFAPFSLLPIALGVPDGVGGWITLVICLIPYPFLLAKLFVGKFPEGVQYVLKLGTDALMFLTEWPGWILGSVTLTMACLRPMFPGVTKTSFHAH